MATCILVFEQWAFLKLFTAIMQNLVGNITDPDPANSGCLSCGLCPHSLKHGTDSRCSQAYKIEIDWYSPSILSETLCCNCSILLHLAVHLSKWVCGCGSIYVYIEVTQAWSFIPILMFNLDFYCYFYTTCYNFIIQKDTSFCIS